MEPFLKKRKTDSKPVCQYGSKCYRKNPHHLQNYSHPNKDSDDLKVNKAEKKGEKTSADTNTTSLENRRHGVDISDSDEETSQPADSNKIGGTEESSGASSPADSGGSKDMAGELEEEEDLISPPASPDDVRDNIKSKFLVEMPEDFYQFWNFCELLNPSDPQNALKKSMNLRLVGPFDVLSGKSKGVVRNKQGRRPNYLLHCRFYFDPPEFQTIAVADDDSQFHLGYYRDDPKEFPVFVASNTPNGSSKEKIVPCGENLYAAVYIHANKQVAASRGDQKTSLQKLIQKLDEEASKLDLPLASSTKHMKQREKKVVCPTFHGAGIVVPVDANDVGYRPVPETPGDLRAMFKRIASAKSETDREKASEELQELITFIQFANDECDYGEGLELGLDLFSYGDKVFHSHISVLLPMAYQLLNRPEFEKIIEAHLKKRRDLSECVDELI